MHGYKPQIFLSYSGDDACEASLLQYALETLLSDLGAQVWTYKRDQMKAQRSIAKSLKCQVRGSAATVFLVSPTTIKTGAAQWMELAYADAFGVPTFVLLHHITFEKLKGRERGVPPLLLEGQCNSSENWKDLVNDLRQCINGTVKERSHVR